MRHRTRTLSLCGYAVLLLAMGGCQAIEFARTQSQLAERDRAVDGAIQVALASGDDASPFETVAHDLDVSSQYQPYPAKFTTDAVMSSSYWWPAGYYQGWQPRTWNGR